MKFALITIGNEILSDLTKDTNSRWISKKINQMGCELCFKITIKDDKVSITNTIRIFNNTELGLYNNNRRIRADKG